MKKTNVISSSNLPMRLPIYQTLTVYLILDKFNAKEWIWGVTGTIFAIIWIAAIVKMFLEKEINIFDNERKDF